MAIVSKRVEDSVTETTHMVMPVHLNGANRLFGGILMQWIDETAGIVAKRHAQCNVITASVDNLKFLKGAYQDDLVVVRGKITYVGRTSMEVRVDTYVEKLSGKKDLANRAYLTQVALDENDKPTEVPRLLLQTEEEKKEWAAGEARAEYRRVNRYRGSKV